MNAGRTAGSRGRHLFRGFFVFVAIFAAGLVTSGVVAGAGPLAVISDSTSTATTAESGTGTTSTETTTTTDSTTTGAETTTETQPAPSGPPTIASDKDDYTPGSTVTLTGTNWAAAEAVHILVNDDQGQSWSYNADVTADSSGSFTNTFQLPNWFVATYTVVATGPISGTATAGFTDSNLTLHLTAAEGVANMSVGWQRFEGTKTTPNNNCSGAAAASGAETIPSSSGTVNIPGGFKDEDSIKLAAATTTTSGKTFDNWTSGTNTTDSGATIPGSPTPCISGNAGSGGNVSDAYAHFKGSNSAPTVDAGGPYSGGEGSNIALNGASASDPDGPAPLSYLWTIDSASVGTGTCSLSNVTSLTSATINCTDNGAATVRLTATEAGPGLSSSDTASVTINNVAPTGTLGNNGPVNEGSSATVSFSSQSEPSSADTSAGLHYAFACDNSSLAGATYAGSGTSASTTCGPFPDGPASEIVRARIIDKDGGFTEYQTTIVVNNVAPTVDLSGLDSANEGETKTYTYTVTDPGQDPSPTITESCGVNGTRIDTATANHFQCTFTDGPNSIVKVTANDGDPSNNTGSDEIDVAVGNRPPVVDVTSPSDGALYEKGATVNVTASFSDPGTGDTHTCSINWDDGSTTTGTVTEANGSGTCSGSHSFGGPGVYTITVTVTDDEGASGSDTVMVVVYDPSAGFVTGGGWINSPAGAYAADPSLTGKANFGFVSKYKKGATVPEGETEFQLHFASFNFHSSAYQWLVVSANGTKAQYKGTGTLNGGGYYGFLLTAYDEPDKFRIKIWNTGTSAVVYDNRVGTSDDIDVADPQAIAGGSIVIHKGK